MYSRSSEPVRFERDCAAVLVPQGEEVTLPAGTVGYITQSLGGSWTVFVEGNLMRIAGKDADAIGKEPPRPIELPEGTAADAATPTAPTARPRRRSASRSRSTPPTNWKSRTRSLPSSASTRCSPPWRA